MKNKEMILKLQQKDQETMETLVEEHSQMIWNAAHKYGFYDDEARELVQNTWITFFDVCKNFQGKSSIKTFIYGIFLLKIKEQRRVQIKDQQFDPLDDAFQSDGHWIQKHPSPDEFAENLEKREWIEDCFQKLPEIQKNAFYMKDVENLETDEVCTTLEITANHCSVLLYRARNYLKQCIELKINEGGKHAHL